MEFSQKIGIIGIIMPSNWDETGRIIEIALYTSNEEVYTVEQNTLSEELLNFMHQHVEINGKIMQHPDGRQSIVAYSYVPLNEIFNDE